MPNLTAFTPFSLNSPSIKDEYDDHHPVVDILDTAELKAKLEDFGCSGVCRTNILSSKLPNQHPSKLPSSCMCCSTDLNMYLVLISSQHHSEEDTAAAVNNAQITYNYEPNHALDFIHYGTHYFVLTLL